jgi:hypothetical protein
MSAEEKGYTEMPLLSDDVINNILLIAGVALGVAFAFTYTLSVFAYFLLAISVVLFIVLLHRLKQDKSDANAGPYGWMRDGGCFGL